MKTMYILYDGECGLCRACREWLEGQEALVDLRFLAYQRALKERRFKDLVVLHPERELVVVSGGGEVWQGAGAWVMCLWGLRRYRWLAGVLAGPSRMGMARGVVGWLSGNRRRVSRWVGSGPAGCDGGCAVAGHEVAAAPLVAPPGETFRVEAGGGRGRPGSPERFHEALSRARLSQDR